MANAFNHDKIHTQNTEYKYKQTQNDRLVLILKIFSNLILIYQWNIED